MFQYDLAMSDLIFTRGFLSKILFFIGISFLQSQLKAQPEVRYDSLYFTIKEIPIKDSIETLKYMDKIQLDNLLYYRSHPYSGYDTIITTTFDNRWKPKLNLAYFNDSLYRCFLIPTSSINLYDKVQWIISNDSQTTTIEIHNPFINYGQNYFIGEISFENKLHSINLKDETLYYDKYARRILDSNQVKKRNRKFEKYIAPKNTTKQRRFKFISEIKRRHRYNKIKRQKKREAHRINKKEPNSQNNAKVIIEPKTQIEKKRKIKTSFSFILKDFPLYGKEFDRMNILDSFKLSYKTQNIKTQENVTYSSKLKFNFLNDSLLRCFQFDVESDDKYHFLYIYLTCPDNKEINLKIPIGNQPDQHFYLGELTPAPIDGIRTLHINTSQKDSTGRILREPIRKPKHWLPKKPKFIGEPNYFVYYGNGKGETDAIVILNGDTIDIIHSQDSMQSKYYFNASTSWSPSYDNPFDLEIIHPDYPNYTHVQKTIHHSRFYLNNNADSSLYPIGCQRLSQWDKKTLCITIDTELPQSYYNTNSTGESRIKDSITSTDNKTIKEVCLKFGLMVKPDYFPPKRYFRPFKLHNVYLLKRKDGKEINLKNGEWLSELRKTPNVNKVLLPTSIGTENEKKGPHISNRFIIKFRKETSKERIAEILLKHQIIEERTMHYAGEQSLTSSCRVKNNELFPSPRLFRKLLTYKEVLNIEYSLEHYYCEYCE